MGRSGVFVTGTDTEIGKTIVAAAMTRALCARGLRVAVMKPVSAGCVRKDGQWVNEDAEILLEQCNIPLELFEANPYAFEPPVSPHIAAADAGVTIELDRIHASYRRIAAGADMVVVEGAGGWLAPIGQRRTMADIAMTLELPIVLVVGMRLGCLNHAMLTAEAIRSRGLSLAGWVANGTDPHFCRPRENLATLIESLDAPLLGTIPFLAPPNLDEVQKALILEPLLAGYLPE